MDAITCTNRQDKLGEMGMFQGLENDGNKNKSNFRIIINATKNIIIWPFNVIVAYSKYFS